MEYYYNLGGMILDLRNYAEKHDVPLDEGVKKYMHDVGHFVQVTLPTTKVYDLLYNSLNGYVMKVTRDCLAGGPGINELLPEFAMELKELDSIPILQEAFEETLDTVTIELRLMLEEMKNKTGTSFSAEF